MPPRSSRSLSSSRTRSDPRYPHANITRLSLAATPRGQCQSAPRNRPRRGCRSPAWHAEPVLPAPGTGTPQGALHIAGACRTRVPAAALQVQCRTGIVDARTGRSAAGRLIGPGRLPNHFLELAEAPCPDPEAAAFAAHKPSKKCRALLPSVRVRYPPSCTTSVGNFKPPMISPLR